MSSRGSNYRSVGLAFVFGCVAIGTALALASSESDEIEPTHNGNVIETALDSPDHSGTVSAAKPVLSQPDYGPEPSGFEPASKSGESQFEECLANASRVETEPCLLAEIDRLDDAIPPATYDAIKQECALEAANEMNSTIFNLECVLLEVSRQSNY